MIVWLGFGVAHGAFCYFQDFCNKQRKGNEMKIQVRSKGGAPLIIGENDKIRVFFRCTGAGCKKSFAIEVESRMERVDYGRSTERVIELDDDFCCPFCGGTRNKLMGRVEKQWAILVRHDVPCDARCTNASGPSCDCSCSGEHHGTGRVIPIYKCSTKQFSCAEV